MGGYDVVFGSCWMSKAAVFLLFAIYFYEDQAAVENNLYR